MPQAQYYNNNPLPRKETNLERTIDAFTSRYKEEEAKKKDISAITDIYEQYERGGNDINKALFAADTNPNLSPTRRVETKQSLLKLQDMHNKNKEQILAAERKKYDEEKSVANEKAKIEEKRAYDEKQNANKLEKQANLIKDYAKQANVEIPEGTDVSGWTTADVRALKPGANKAAPLPLGGKTNQSRIVKQIGANNELANKSRQLLSQAPLLEQSIENLKKTQQLLNVGLSYIPVVGEGISEKRFNEDEQAVNTITKEAILKSGDLQGLRLTDYKLRYIQGALPTPFKSYEANKIAFDIWKKKNELIVKTQEAQNELIKELEDQGMTDFPANFDELLQQKMDEKGLNDELDQLVDEAKTAPESVGAKEGAKREEKKEKKAEKKVEKNMSALPAADKYPGKTVKDNNTGKSYKSINGVWVVQ